ncbi:acyltransferase [bacterium]|nr:acyltransferase [bacterium]MBU1883798.1 acyltransferase [bacterium]
MRFNFYKRVYRYMYRQLFNLLFSNRFKYFGKNISIISPDIIDGEEYIYLEDGVSIGSLVWLLAYKQGDVIPELHICSQTTIGRFAHIVALRKIVIEKNVLIADKVYISDNIHSYQDVNVPIKEQSIEFKGEVIIGENSWIGENVSIVGAKIGKHCIVGANSFVNKDVPDYCVVGGIPAKILKKYDFTLKEWIKVEE